MAIIVEFFKKLYQDHLITTVIFILIFCVLIVCGIVLSQIAKAKKERKMFKENAENAINSLTPEEIDNISHNVADKKVFYELMSNPTGDGKIKEEPSDKTAVENQPQTTPIATDTSTQDKKVENDETQKVKKPTSEKISTAQKSSKTKTTREYSGKWKIKKLDGKYFAELIASNGGLLLKTEQYTTLASLKNGIETLKKNIDFGNIVITFDNNGFYRFKIYTPTNRLICISESYSSKAKCENGILSVKRFSKSDTIIIEDSIN
ncbi:MAG: DUF1508 domain-containing protein [Clostridia bacterium]|nr:DUF1508 domain-containing protein [Clostridia bacterium]